eukprot:scaffold4001_cov94-Cylindrotheca_fusiformis.AAC.8
MVYRTFPFRLHQILEEASNTEEESRVISWSPSGDSFKIHDVDAFETTILPKYLPKQNKYKSFKRQLQYYGFTNFGFNHYGHPSFLRDQKSLLCQIEHRAFKKNKKHSHPQFASDSKSDVPNATTASTRPEATASLLTEEKTAKLRAASCSLQSPSPVPSAVGSVFPSFQLPQRRVSLTDLDNLHLLRALNVQQYLRSMHQSAALGHHHPTESFAKLALLYQLGQIPTMPLY